MDIEVLGCFGGMTPEHKLTCLLIDETVAIDAGSLGSGLPLERQLAVRSVVLTHAHSDHTRDLPFFVDNVFGQHHDGLDVYASEPATYAVRRHVLNSDVWPDFSRLPNHLVPWLRLRELAEETTLAIGDLRITPFAVNHPVPTYGLLLESGGSAVLWSSDTGPTDRLWEIANRTPNLQAIFLDVSFCNRLQSVADESGHLTPLTMQRELRKLDRDVPILLQHLKPAFIDEIRAEVAALGLRSVGFLEQGRRYSF
jgi:ribonuclease BN (tRNA processing enzyme)